MTNATIPPDLDEADLEDAFADRFPACEHCGTQRLRDPSDRVADQDMVAADALLFCGATDDCLTARRMVA